ncbi:hypothetical protein [Oceanobacillus kapialis]|uniref:Short-chain dehydrogenase n=1 Tax=Oceanobacillus kapialis TaxID=481353 RepID=A0ABW5Q004_9BACI
MSTDLTLEFLLLKLSLYKEVIINDKDLEFIQSVLSRYKENQFDSYCVTCQKEVPFKKQTIMGTPKSLSGFGGGSQETKEQRLLRNIQGPHSLSYTCQKNNDHKYQVFFQVEGRNLVKIGQFPSIADLELHKIDKYRRILKSDYRDFSKSIGLYSHGVGAGSFVYLRRIFENLIEQNREKAAQQPSWDNLYFQQARMDDKIRVLQEYLPSVLVENRKLYSILSKGIHELTEEECLEMFPKVQLAIELILDEKIHELEKQSKLQTVRDFVSETVGKYKS